MLSASPAQVPPPMKKQRGGATPESSKLTKDASEAIARRRAELNRLQTSFDQRRTFQPSQVKVEVPRMKDVQPSVIPKLPSLGDKQPVEQLPRRLADNFDSHPQQQQQQQVRSVSVPTSRPPPPPPPPKVPPSPSSGNSISSPPLKVPSAPSSGNALPLPASNALRHYVGRPEPVTPVSTKNTAQQTGFESTKPAKIPAPNGHEDYAPPNATATTSAVSATNPPLNKVSFFQPNASNNNPTKKITSFAPSPLPSNSTPLKSTPQQHEPESTSPHPGKALAGLTPHANGKVFLPQQQQTSATPYVKLDFEYDVGDTPFHKAHEDTSDTTPSTVRRDMLRGLRAVADSPTLVDPRQQQQKHNDQSPELRIQKELAQTQKEKAEALKKVTEMEKELEKYKEQVEKQLAESRNVAFLSPIAPESMSSPLPQIMSRISMQRSPRRPREATPYPKKRYMSESEDDDFYSFLAEAAALVPFDYESDQATFFVRRPHGAETEQELWFENGMVGAKVYAKQATVQHMDTIEVVALIAPDASRLVLFNEASVRHGNRDGSWQELDSDRPLGHVTYIDSEANEQMYSLDDIYDKAVSVRESYCSSLLATAVALQQKKKQEATLPPKQQPPKVVAKPPAVDACVGTEDLFQIVPAKQSTPPVLPATREKPRTATVGVGTDDLPKPTANKPPPPRELPKVAPPDDDNILAVFWGMIVSLLWTVLFKIPWRIFTTCLTLGVSIALVGLVWLYLAEQQGFRILTGPSPVTFLFNPPGVV